MSIGNIGELTFEKDRGIKLFRRKRHCTETANFRFVKRKDLGCSFALVND